MTSAATLLRHLRVGAMVLVAFAGLLATGPGAAAEVSLRRGINFESWQRWTNKAEFTADWYDRSNFPDWTRAVDDGKLANLRRQGFDFVRLNVDPSPFFWDETGADALLDRVIAAVTRLQALDFRVVVDLHLVPDQADRPFGLHHVLATGGVATSDGFDLYLALVTKVAKRLTALPADRTALELLNEPDQDWFSYTTFTDRWPKQLEALVRAARRGAPDLTLVVSGGRGGGVEGLVRLDPTPLLGDPNLIWSFHIYDPGEITHSGLPWDTSAGRFLVGLPFPASVLDKPMRARLLAAADGRIAAAVPEPAERAKLETAVRAQMDKYVASKASAATIAASVGEVAVWATRYGIRSDRILMGEFGVHQDAVAPATRAAIIRATREAAERQGFTWAIYTANLTQPRHSFGIVDDAATLAVEPVVRDALGLP